MFPPIIEYSGGGAFNQPTHGSYEGFKVDKKVLRGHKLGQGLSKGALSPGQPEQLSFWSDEQTKCF